MSLLTRYRNIPKPTLQVIGAKYLVALLNGSFLLILNLYLRKQGMSDSEIGAVVSYQYAGVLLLSLPLGLYIRGRRLKPFLTAGALIVPLVGMGLLLSFRLGHYELGKWLMLLWSMGLLQLESFSLPFIFRMDHKDSETEAVSLAYAAHSFGTVASGLIVAAVLQIGTFHIGDFQVVGDEFLALMVVGCLALPGVLLVRRVVEPTPDPTLRLTRHNLGSILRQYDWGMIARGLFPATLLAVGAGLTIPFINLFFNGVFGMDSDEFGLIGTATSALVFFVSLSVPALRRRYGYGVAVTLVQCVAVLALICLALTQLLAEVPGMVAVATAMYMIRSPLMNMAGPSTNELFMNYVGARNRDLAGALHASIWSGGWFVSARIFRWLRAEDIPYYQIFLATSCMYVIGIVLYVLLIRDYRRRLMAQAT